MAEEYDMLNTNYADPNIDNRVLKFKTDTLTSLKTYYVKVSIKDKYYYSVIISI